MNKEKLKVDDDIIYNVVSSSADKITLERFNKETNRNFIIELKNCKNVEKDIIEVLSNQYIRRLSEITQLHK